LKNNSIVLLFVFLICQETLGQVVNLRGDWKFQIGDKASWAAADFNDSDWESIKAPLAWEEQGFNGYDGFAWYRKKFDGRVLSSEERYYLDLGYIDDCDEVYLNGKLVGVSGSMPPKFKTAYNNERKYVLNNEAINFKGTNTIAIRVFDVIHGGGIIDGELGIYEAPKSRMIADLDGLWDFVATDWDKAAPVNAEWKKITVPGPWEPQGYPRYDGYAWYKRTFTLPKNFSDKDQELVLMVGRIDDFDKTYLNGKLIGKTNDERPYGDSHSFEKLRAYTVPAGLLKTIGVNTVEVFVEDMGNIGGIYEGPVGLATRTVYERYYKD
jgi:sialate O-acetylesterase